MTWKSQCIQIYITKCILQLDVKEAKAIIEDHPQWDISDSEENVDDKDSSDDSDYSSEIDEQGTSSESFFEDWYMYKTDLQIDSFIGFK